MRSCYLLALFSLVSLVAGDPGSAAIGAAENIFEVINGRGQFAEIQRIMSEQIVSNLNIDGNVEAASVGSSLDALIRPQRDALFSMRDCIVAQQTDTRGEDIATASYHGVYSDEGWDRTKEENAVDCACLAPVWNQSVTGTTVLQAFLGSSGFIEGYFTDLALNTAESSIDETSDARTNPNFVSSTTFQKQVIIMLDFSNLPEEDGVDFLAAMKLGSHAVIQGLSDLDFIQVVTSVPGFDKGFDCGGEQLLRGTESNKKAIMDYVDTLTSPGPNDPSHLTPLEIFSNAFNLTPIAGSAPSCQPLFLYVSANQFAKGNVREITVLNEEFGAFKDLYFCDSVCNRSGRVLGRRFDVQSGL